MDERKGGLVVEVRVSSKYQVVIPKEIRARLNIHKGQKLEVFLKGDVVNLVPEKSLGELRGFLRGMDICNWREEDERI
ncbi:MAG: AbrB/MazE/SpoVT family DNA-binding domain-containing protein [Armatimonadetes bacterium]|nr:AbrB/MazE/SpoVT family DNA-binding domain-containing protein [Armatimonadota bacterium]